MPVTKQWVHAFSKRDLKKFLALSIYNKQAEVLLIHANEHLNRYQDTSSKMGEKYKEYSFEHGFKPLFKMYASMLYVIYEGFKELNIKDIKINKIKANINMDKLKLFRNATFHFQPHIFNPKHDDYINTVGPEPISELGHRQAFLIRKISRFASDSPALLAAPWPRDLST